MEIYERTPFLFPLPIHGLLSKDKVGYRIDIDNLLDWYVRINRTRPPQEVMSHFAAANHIFNNYREKYHIPIPLHSVIWGEYNNVDVLYTVAQRVHGAPFQDGRFTLQEQRFMHPSVDATYTNFLVHAENIIKEGGGYLTDFKNEQFMYGHTKNDPEDKLYFIDMDPYFHMFDPKHVASDGTRYFFELYLQKLRNGLVSAEKILGGKQLANAREKFNELLQIIPEKYSNMLYEKPLETSRIARTIPAVLQQQVASKFQLQSGK